MGRAPCCDKANVKRGPWAPEEDSKLKSYIDQHGTGGNWIALPQKIGLKRCGKSCRLRWLNYLRPNIKHGGFSEEEDNIICSLYISIGSRWSIIAAQLPGRTDNDIKNYWNTRLKKKLLGKHRKEQQLARKMKVSAGSSSLNSVVQAVDDQSPYWPELPILAVQPNHHHQQQQQQPCFNDHASIRKLLIKLGGRFTSDVHQNEIITNVQPSPTNVDDHQLPIGIPSYTQQVYDQQHHQHSSPPMSVADIMISPHQFAEQAHYMVMNTDNVINVNGDGDGVNMFQGQNGHYGNDHQLKEMEFNNNNTQRLDGLEFLYGEEMMNMVMNNGETSSSIGWGEMQLICPPSVAASSSSDDYDQGMERLMPVTQESCAFHNLNGLSSYPDVQ